MNPAQEPSNINRRPLDLEDYIDIARRHRAWLIGPTFVALVAAVVIACLWPDTYVSTATIRVVPPSVSERYVVSNVSTAEISQRINSMASVILSRTALVNIIQTFNLYPRERRSQPIEDLVEEMKKSSIKIGNVFPTQRANSTAFQVEFRYSNRVTAQKVCQDLVSRFIDENVRLRSNQSSVTTSFLKDQWDAAQKELKEAELKLGTYQAVNRDRMPEQANVNLQELHSIETQLNSVMGNISRAGMEKQQLESSIAELKKELRYASTPTEEITVAQENNQRLAELDKNLSNLRMVLSSLRERYSDEHPDVKRLRSEIAMLEANRATLLSEESHKAPSAPVVRRRLDPNAVKEIKNIEANINRMTTEVQIREQQIQENNKLQAALTRQMNSLQARIQGGTLSDGQYLMLQQDRDLARKKYDALDAKKTESELANDLENRKASETLEMLDAANLPLEPVLPNRPMIILGGTFVGLIIGCAFAGVFEMRDATLKNLKDVRAYTQLSVLASVPLLENDLMVRRRRRLRWLAWSAGFLIGALVMAGAVTYYLVTK